MVAHGKKKTRKKKAAHAHRKRHAKKKEGEEGDVFVLAQKVDIPFLWGDVEKKSKTRSKTKRKRRK
ncbi:MAG: hypothetical protein V1776_02605 [Candidatus Diapherotrites archaeon]